MLSDKRWISFLIKPRLKLTLSRESPAAGCLCRQFGSFWKRQAEQHDQGLACRHVHRWHFYPGGRFRQRRGFSRTRRWQICAVHGDGELGRRGKIDKWLTLTTLLSSKSITLIKKISCTVHSDDTDQLAFRGTCWGVIVTSAEEGGHVTAGRQMDGWTSLWLLAQ